MHAALVAEAQAIIDQKQANICLTGAQISELNRVSDLLEMLPQKTKHQAMVPLGKAAMFPGQLIHTNECIVKLGDSHWVERSAYQTGAFLARRRASLQTRLSAAQQELDELKEQLKAAKEEGPLLDIVEEYDEAVHGRLRNADRAQSATKPPPQQFAHGNSSTDSAHAALMKRMEELEEAEAQEAEQAARACPEQAPATVHQQKRGTTFTGAGASHGKPPFARGFLDKPPSKALLQPRSPPFAAQTGGTEAAVLSSVVERSPAKQLSGSIDSEASSGRKGFQRNQKPVRRAGNVPEEPKKLSRFKQQVTARFQA